MNGKPSSPVLRGLGASDGARLLDPWDYFLLARHSSTIAKDVRYGALSLSGSCSGQGGAGSLGGQADTAEQSLEARVRAEVINPQVSLEVPGHFQGSLLISFF